MKSTVAQQFKNAIQNWMHSPDYREKKGRNFGVKIRARVIIDDAEPKLARLFLLEATERICRALERAEERGGEEVGERDEAQLKLLGPGFAELFVSIRERLPLKSGRKKQFALMTATEFDESADAIWSQAKKGAAKNIEKAEQRAKYLHDLARQMRPHAASDPGLTFRDFAKLPAAGSEASEQSRAGARAGKSA